MVAVHAPALYTYVYNYTISAFDPWLIPSSAWFLLMAGRWLETRTGVYF
jgi:hypothetical protein